MKRRKACVADHAGGESRARGRAGLEGRGGGGGGRVAAGRIN